MSSPLPNVRQAVLEYRPGEENLALRIVFEERLNARQHGFVLRGVASFIEQNDRILETEFPRGEIVVLQPAPEQGHFDQSDFRTMVQHFGYEPKGDLPIVSFGQSCRPEDGEVTLITNPTSWIH